MASELVNDLKSIPGIIGELGKSIAEAQKVFDANYLSGLERLAALAKAVLGADQQGVSADFVRHLIETAAPPRYQFTETTLSVKLDLSESRDIALGVSGGVGFAGVVVNASFAYGYSSDYRAGAEIRTVLHAVLPQDNKAAFSTLLDRAKDLPAITLPALSQLDQNVFAAVEGAAKAAGANPVMPKIAAPPAPAAPAADKK